MKTLVHVDGHTEDVYIFLVLKCATLLSHVLLMFLLFLRVLFAR